jgi:ketosteroid isomerase-like protein
MRVVAVFTGLALLALLPGAPAADAQSAEDPAAIVNAFSAAFNAHDLDAALALFDPNGSATDIRGRQFDGRPGLTEFLLASGFGTANAQITTTQLQVVGNRALWTYSCSCAAEVMNVGVVLNHNRIVMFFVTRPAARDASATARPSGAPSAALWPAAIALVVAIVLTVRGLRREAPPAPRPAQGRLLAGLQAFKDARGA